MYKEVAGCFVVDEFGGGSGGIGFFIFKGGGGGGIRLEGQIMSSTLAMMT